MIGHYLKLVWNRRRANGLILFEILVSFLVLCAVAGVVVYSAQNWRRPLGFDYRNVWTVDLNIPQTAPDDSESVRRNLEVSQQLLATMSRAPHVEAVAPLPNTPYSGSMTRSGIRLRDGGMVQFLMSPTTPEVRDVLKLELVAGRWLEPGDELLGFTPYVITQDFARRMYGRDNPIGRTIDTYKDGHLIAPTDSREVRKVVGVIRSYRKAGEFVDMPYAAFVPMAPSDPQRGGAPSSYVIRVNPGTPAAFEETMLKALQAEAPEWTFSLRSIELERQRSIRGRLLPIAFAATLAGFLILMVGMGLMGVLWQSVTRRTQELGLRRALGATAGAVRNQIIGEIVVLTAIALLVGTVLLLQVPLLGVLPFVGIGVFVTAIVASCLVIVPFVILCGLYPGWLATQVEPSRALQYE